MDVPHKSPPPNYADRGSGIVDCAIVAMVLSTLVVMVRFWSRAVTTSLLFWWDDWAMLLTLHAWMISLDKVNLSAVANLVALVLYCTCVWLIKISALLLYSRIFKRSSRAFLICLKVTGIAMTAWWMINAIVPWSFCDPWKKNVEPLLPGVCQHHIEWYLSSAFINASLDLVVLLLPMPAIWRLQMNLQKKISVMVIFLLGYSSAFLSFARFIIIVRNPNILATTGPDVDPSWNLVPLLYFSMLEAPLAILALCGPSVNQLVSRAVKYRSLSSLFTTSPHPTPTVQTAGCSRKHGHDTNKYGFSGLGSTPENSSSRPFWPLNGSSSSMTVVARLQWESDEERRIDNP
ncbi:hypothetical protein TOPH_07233 [Tolypocladium ophioglossoides CBS 100239]|uniref:Rhodopsin domain-containing protein n=1 Tax=Tolypocladium ophioglossoides (strain CBS 100239) TaxID=1163406 RepID=A0A0L0N1X5_TOLOC|nr:hypothetical protein TOPH_07233 [Tolypocladium ophioglossoides CBS 100239]